MRVTIARGSIDWLVEYGIDPVDLIRTASEQEYEVTIWGENAQGFSIGIEADQQRVKFQALNSGCSVFRRFKTSKVLVIEIARCLPELQEYSQHGYATWFLKDGHKLHEFPWSKLAELAEHSQVIDFMAAQKKRGK